MQLVNNKPIKRYRGILFIELCLFLVFLKSMFADFTWEFNVVIVGFIGLLGCLLFILRNPNAINVNKGDFISILLFSIARIYSIRDGNINALIGAIISILIIAIVILLRDKIKIEILFFFTKVMAVLLFISLCAWLLFCIGVEFPYEKTSYNEGQYMYNNYYFFLINLKTIVEIPRFTGFFLEPGQLGMITAFLLFVNKFNLKRKEVLVLLFVTISTLSLAAYIITITSLLLLLFVKFRNGIIYFTICMCVLFSGYVFFSSLNNGDNVFNKLIIERLKIEDGDIAGNNRFSSDLDSYFEMFIKSNDKYLGIGGSKYYNIIWDAGNAGYKVFIIQHGFIGIFLILLFYMSVLIHKYSKLGLILLFAYILCFMQASYPFWECELFIFIVALPYLKFENHG